MRSGLAVISSRVECVPVPLRVPTLRVPLRRCVSLPFPRLLLTILASSRLVGYPAQFSRWGMGVCGQGQRCLPQVRCHGSTQQMLCLLLCVFCPSPLPMWRTQEESHSVVFSETELPTAIPVYSQNWGDPGSAPSVSSLTQIAEKGLPFIPREVTEQPLQSC